MTTANKPQRDLCSLAYLIKGFWAAIRIDNNYEQAKDEAGGAEDYLMADLIKLGELDDELWQQLYANSGDLGPRFSGVWYYEISEIFGAQVAGYVNAHGMMPDKEKARELIAAIHKNSGGAA